MLDSLETIECVRHGRHCGNAPPFVLTQCGRAGIVGHSGNTASQSPSEEVRRAMPVGCRKLVVLDDRRGTSLRRTVKCLDLSGWP
jgi:hypothetical protein